MKNTPDNLYAVILAGGYGERFWPWSRRSRPKQFLPVADGRVMLRAAFERLRPLIPAERVFVCTNREFTARVGDIAPEIPPENVVSEPASRNTAPAVGLSAVAVGRRDRNAVMAVMPSDHVITGEEKFRKSLKRAALAASDGKSLVVFGVKPDYPETGYGYVKAGKRVSRPGMRGGRLYAVDRFEEKPGLPGAKRFLKSGKYYWNSGMFVWSCSAIMSEIKEHMPELHEGLIRISREGPAAAEKVYGGIKGVSVDYGVLEKTRSGLMLEADFGWDDVGAWDALGRVRTGRRGGNVVAGGEFLGIDTKNTVIAGDGVFIASIGVSDLVIAACGDAVLVCSRERSQEVKKLLEKMKKNKNLRKFLA